MTIDLLPREMKERARRRRLQLSAAMMAFVLVLGIVGVRLELARQVKVWESRVEQIEADRARLARLADKKAEIAHLEQLLKGETFPAGSSILPWGELLWYLARVTPPEVTLQEMRWDGTTIVLSGLARDLATTASLIQALEACPYLDGVAVTRVTGGGPKGPVVFSLAAKWGSK